MTKSKKLLLTCGILLVPLATLITVILRAAALLTQFNGESGYFMHSETLYTAFLWAFAVAFLLFVLAAILTRRSIGAPPFRPSLTILFSSSFFMVTLLVATVYALLSLGNMTDLLPRLFLIVAAVCAVATLIYLGLFCRPQEPGGVRHGLLGLPPAFFALFTAILLYFDRAGQMNAPAKLLELSAFLLLSCFFLVESRCLFGAPQPAFYFFVSAATVLTAASAALPNLLYTLIEGRALVLSTVYDFVLLAASLYIFARLLQLLPYETPSMHRMVRRLLMRAEAAAAAEAEEKEDAEEAPAAKTEETPQ